MSEQQLAKEMLRTTTDIINKTNKFLQEILKVLKEQSLENEGAKSLYKHYQAGKGLKNINLPEEEIEAFKKHLIATGVPYVIFDLKNDDTKSIIFRNIDEEKISLALKAHYVEQKKVNKMSYEDFMFITPTQNVTSINKLTEVEAFMIGEEAKKQGFYYTVVKDKDRYNLLFNKIDKDLVEMALINVAWDLSGNLKNYHAAVATQKAELEKAIQKDFAKEDFFIVDNRNTKNYFMVHGDKVDYIKNNQHIKSFSYSELERQVKVLKEPVLMSEKEFLDLSKTLESKIPIVKEEEVIKQERIKDLYNSKISLITNNINDIIANDPYNNDVSIGSYIDDELINIETTEKDIDREELKEHIKNTIEYKTNYEFVTKTKELDKIISKAESQAETYNVNTQERGFTLGM